MAMTAEFPELTFRQDYFADGAAWTAFVALLQDTFGIDIDPLRRLGGPDPSCMPFGWFDADGTLVANLAAFSLPLTINGRMVRAAAFQSGAVRPAWRGRGLYRDVTQKALEWCKAEGFEAIVLYTDKPALYEPYGFRSLPLHLHIGAAPAPMRAPMPLRSLDPWQPGDLALLQRALGTRSPVSDGLAVCESAAMFLINTQFDPDVRLSWMEDEQAVIAWKMDGERFILLDVVAPAIPALAAILGGMDVQPNVAEVLFRPDKIAWSGEPQPLESATRFMIKADFPVTLDTPAMLSPMADF